MAARFDSGSLETYGAVQSTGAEVTVPDAALLFTGDYSRSGTDLTITGSDGAKFVVAGYFETDTPPSLMSPTGGGLTGDVVTALAGPQYPGMYAQAGGGAASAAKEIGKVQTLEGSGTVVRTNGVTETLKVGDPVYEGDVVMTGPASKMGIGFVDGTVFSMSASARMVLNSLIYDANGSDNSMLFSLVEGSFVFAAGQIAPTGDMKIQTPVATMGIRGTAPTVDIIKTALGNVVNFSIVPDPDDGHIGNYTLYNTETGAVIGNISSTGSTWSLNVNGTITEFDKSEDDLLRDAEAINQINNVYNTYQTNTQNQQNPQAGPENNPPPSSGGFNTNPNQGENVDGSGQNNGGGEQQQQQQQQDDSQPGNNAPPSGDQTNNDPPPVIDDPDDPGINVINGTPFDDNGEIVDGVQNPPALVGTNGKDFIFGFAGDDHITALDGDDFIDAGDGNDTVLAGDGDDTIIGGHGEGGDHYDGGEGTDTAVYTSTNNDVIVNLVDGTVQGDDIGFDTIASLERFVMGGGNDTLIVDADTGWFFDGGDGVDTIQIAGDLNIDTSTLMSEVENIEVIDLNETDANTLTISVDDFINAENNTNSLTIRGGMTDIVNLTNLALPFDGAQNSQPGDGFYEGSWVLLDPPPQDTPEGFNVWQFVDPDDEVLAVAQIDQDIQVNTFTESFENGFGPNGWEVIEDDSPDGPTTVDNDSTEGSSSARLSTTVGDELDDPTGAGDSEDNDQEVPRGNVEDIADLLGIDGIDIEEDDFGVLDDLAGSQGQNGRVIEGSAIQTTFFAMPGQVLSFDWFFSTYEFEESDGEGGTEFVNDIAFVVIDGEIFKLFDAESAGNTTEGNLAEEGWNQFSIILGEGGDGHEHTIAFGVLDNDDIEVETNLNIDNIQLGLPAELGVPIEGGPGNDTLIVDADTGWFFDGGDGIDTIQISGALDINTATMLSDAIHVEIIDMNNDASNTLTMSVDDFVDPQNDTGTIQIKGDEGDTVILTNSLPADPESGFAGGFYEGSWQLAGTTELDGTDYNIYLFLQNDIPIPLGIAAIEVGVDVQTTTTHTVRDEFNHPAYNGNDGSQDWKDDWNEQNDDFNDAEDGSPTEGEIFVSQDSHALAQSYQLTLTDDDNENAAPDYVQRTVDLTGALTATLAFDFRRVDLESDDEVIILASSGDGQFTELGRISGESQGSQQEGSGITDDGYQTLTFNISQFASYNTIIQFAVGDDLEGGTGDPFDIVYIDNVTITYDTISGPPQNINQGPEAPFDDIVLGTNKDDEQIEDQESGNDLHLGFNGNDYISTDGNNETIIGGGGDDELEVFSGDNILIGGPGNDLLESGPNSGSNFLDGGEGDDTFTLDGDGDYAIGGDGSDVFRIHSDGGRDSHEIADFSELDALDLTELLVDAFPDGLPSGQELSEIINQYVQALEDGNGNVSIGVDTNGETGGSEFTEIAVLRNVGEDVTVGINIGGNATSILSDEPVPAETIT